MWAELLPEVTLSRSRHEGKSVPVLNGPQPSSMGKLDGSPCSVSLRGAHSMPCTRKIGELHRRRTVVRRLAEERPGA